LGDRDASESLVQDVFVNIWEKRKRIEIRSLKGFLVVTVRNRCTNELKHQKVVREFEKSDAVAQDMEWPKYNETIYLDRINQVIDELPTQRQRIFRMSRMDGLKYREIAEKLNISPKTVEVQMGKALKYLREKLQPLKQQLFSVFL
jgi:RNA polymerase sigma-70 factor (ECF subfamily)